MVGGVTAGDTHMVAARLGFKKAMVGTEWTTSLPDRMDKLRKHYSHLVEGWFLVRESCLGSEWVYDNR